MSGSEGDSKGKPIDWSLATFEGARRDQLLRFADATPAERFAWFCEMYELLRGQLRPREDTTPDW